ncbi:hypothetical protein ACIRQH_35190 [Streptomyces sp. NPDC102279]|uniref:hypothetical protein n=1 Tax=Streptomyces sp. NPDC102279 TaxID=3366153 RepID=UPI0038235840
MDETAILAALGADPTTLDPAPEHLHTADARRRFGRPCSSCGTPGVSTRIIRLPHGHCWLDSCRDHMLKSFRLREGTGPRTVDVFADLREAAAEAGVALTVITDEAAG